MGTKLFSLTAVLLLATLLLPSEARAYTVRDSSQYYAGVSATAEEKKQTIEKEKAMKNMEYNSIMTGMKGLNSVINKVNSNISEAAKLINSAMTPVIPVQILENTGELEKMTDFVSASVSKTFATTEERKEHEDLQDAINQVSAVTTYGKTLASRKIAEGFDSKMDELFKNGQNIENTTREYIGELSVLTSQMVVQLSQINMMHSLILELKSTRIVAN
ncbi:MAG: hypothetical protein KAJ75_07595 [Alphaproteobacteria bacterium]|nr:hypothetical protein [Alphaproteobacteria bacterium]